MSRPKSAPDPERYPTPCARCGEHRAGAARWPEGHVCQNCYRKATRTRGTCASCGHRGVLPGIRGGQATCRACSGIRLNVDCRSCGREDEIYAGGRCWHCALAGLVDEALADPASGKVAPGLEPLASGLKAMERANSGLTWIRQPHVQDFLHALARAGTPTHEGVDALPASKTREYVRGLLVEHGVLPRRDRYLVVFGQWLEAALERVTVPSHRDAVQRYARWHHLRRMRGMGEVPRGTFLRSKQTVTVTIDFLNWLADRGVALECLGQADLDDWQSTGPTTRLIAAQFLSWARKARLTRPDLTMRSPRRGTYPRMGAAEQAEATQRVVHTRELAPRDRAIGILVLVFGQQLEDIVRLRWEDLKISGAQTSIRLGATDIHLPHPLDEPWRQLAQTASNRQTAAHPNSPWVFPGYTPGRPVSPGHIAEHLKHVFRARAARLGTLHELSKLGPVPIVAEALGYAPATIEAHRVDSAAAYARYVGTIKEITAAADRPPA